MIFFFSFYILLLMLYQEKNFRREKECVEMVSVSSLLHFVNLHMTKTLYKNTKREPIM